MFIHGMANNICKITSGSLAVVAFKASSLTAEGCGSVLERRTMEQKVGVRVEKYLHRVVPLSKMFTPQK